MRVFLFTIALLFYAQYILAQGDAGRFSLDPLSKAEEFLSKPGLDVHRNLQPFVAQADSQWFLRDSLSASTFNKKFRVNPIGSVAGGVSMTGFNSRATMAVSPGVQLNYKPGKRWDLGAVYQGVWERPPFYMDNFAAANHVLPGVGYATKDSLGYFSHYYEGRIGYQAGKYFHFEVGRGRHFWGDGYRSVLLSHNAAPSPYFRIDTRVWKLKLTNIIGKFSDLPDGANFDKMRYKYGALHALSWNVSRLVNITFYEMVIWQDRDSLSDRGVEFNYLHPLLFLRPVEYAQGSADNVLLALSMNVKTNTGQQFYGSVMIDEFVLSEVQRNLGWWANKYSIQGGFKAFNVLTPGLHFQLEGNFARPFTYSHGSRVQAYGHLNQGLAHPLNTNFQELIFFARYYKNDWSFLFAASGAEFGRDTELENYGGNLFRSYVDPLRKYGNFLGQGVHHSLWIQRLEVARTLRPGLELFGEGQWRSEFSEGQGFRDYFFQLGIRTPMVRPYRDF